LNRAVSALRAFRLKDDVFGHCPLGAHRAMDRHAVDGRGHVGRHVRQVEWPIPLGRFVGSGGDTRDRSGDVNVEVAAELADLHNGNVPGFSKRNRFGDLIVWQRFLRSRRAGERLDRDQRQKQNDAREGHQNSFASRQSRDGAFRIMCGLHRNSVAIRGSQFSA